MSAAVTALAIGWLGVRLRYKFRKAAALLKRHTRNPEAHEFYLRDLAYFIRWTPEFSELAQSSIGRISLIARSNSFKECWS